MNYLHKYINGFYHLFFPKLCFSCNESLVRGEDLVCTECMYHIGRTNYHLDKENPVVQLFYGRVELDFALSYFKFDKGGRFQKLMYQLKYKGQKEVGEMLGKHLGMGLKNSTHISSIDYVVPVPLHKKKEKLRGYNQSYHIALGISKVLNVPIESKCLMRVTYKGSQTKLSRENRWENVCDNFEVQNDVFEGKHILLVDDVLTTGATIEACCVVLNKIPNVKISVATLARAQ